MLQIISGKFFKSEDRWVHDGKGILYSNYGWVAPIETCIGILEPVDSYRAVSSYVFSYKNQIERTGRGPGELIRVGDPEIVRQFLLLCIFGLRAYFAEDRAAILTNCRTKPISASDVRVPSHFASRILDAQIQGNNEEVAEFVRLVKQVIFLPRACYCSVMSVLENLEHAIQAINWNIDLAYSMVVYCLESLAQDYDQYSPEWRDFDDITRKAVDVLLERVDPSVSSDIRSALLKNAHLKLSTRFFEFVEAHIDHTYFTVEACGIQNPLRKSFLRRSLKNAYTLRSAYVHRLQPIRDQLRHVAFSKDDTFMWKKEPYFTFNGLLRLTFHVIRNFVFRQPSMDTEDHNWRRKLPGTLEMKLGPEYWLGRHEHLDKPHDISGDARTRFSGFLQHIVQQLRTKQAITDMRGVLAKYQKLIPHARRLDRIRMLGVYLIYNALVVADSRVPGWEKFFEKYEKELSLCCIETMVIKLLLLDGFDENYETCCKVYEEFRGTRFAKNAIDLPVMLELKLQAELANMALRSSRPDDFARYIGMMITDCPGNSEAQRVLSGCQSSLSEVPHEIIFPVIPKRTDDAPPSELPASSDETAD